MRSATREPASRPEGQNSSSFCRKFSLTLPGLCPLAMRLAMPDLRSSTIYVSRFQLLIGWYMLTCYRWGTGWRLTLMSFRPGHGCHWLPLYAHKLRQRKALQNNTKSLRLIKISWVKYFKTFHRKSNHLLGPSRSPSIAPGQCRSAARKPSAVCGKGICGTGPKQAFGTLEGRQAVTSFVLHLRTHTSVYIYI